MTQLSRCPVLTSAHVPIARLTPWIRLFKRLFLHDRAPLLTLNLEALSGEAQRAVFCLVNPSLGCAAVCRLGGKRGLQGRVPVLCVEYIFLAEVQIAPHPDDLKLKILDLIDDVTKATDI